MATRTISVKRFLGLHETGEGSTQIKLGEASRIENFAITDNSHISVRPAAKMIIQTEVDLIVGAWSGYIGDQEFLAVATGSEYEDRRKISLYKAGSTEVFQALTMPSFGITQVGVPEPYYVTFFAFRGNLYCMSNRGFWRITKDAETFSLEEVAGYVPVVIINAKPAGGGTTLENINLLTGRRRIRYDGDGESSQYKLPDEATDVTTVKVNGLTAAASSYGKFNNTTKILGFKDIPTKGINNVEIEYKTNTWDAAKNLSVVTGMRFAEAYNGATDTRIFLYGDGTNRCIYSGITEDGEPSAEYFPALFEITVDANDSPITGMVRHQNRLIAFKPDGAFSIAYDAITLADGTTVPGFYVQTLNRTLGNQAPGQVQSVQNYPRTITTGAIYDWRLSSYYQDERHAKIISENVAETVRNIDPGKVVAYDDNINQTYYLFINDEEGTVLVHRYTQDLWTMYKGEAFQKVTSAGKFGNTIWFASESLGLWIFTNDAYDTLANGVTAPIRAVWESGYMDAGADNMRKNSSLLWVSMYPEPGSAMKVTAASDQRDEYAEKIIGANYMGYGAIDYAHWSYSSSRRPRIIRVKLKVKKHVFRKVIFIVDTPGSRATVLAFDVEVQYSGKAK